MHNKLRLQTINTFIEISSFPEVWKIARITPIPKSESIATESDVRPYPFCQYYRKYLKDLSINRLCLLLMHMTCSKITYQALGKATRQALCS